MAEIVSNDGIRAPSRGQFEYEVVIRVPKNGSQSEIHWSLPAIKAQRPDNNLDSFLGYFQTLSLAFGNCLVFQDQRH
jgi:hypothetical protein